MLVTLSFPDASGSVREVKSSELLAGLQGFPELKASAQPPQTGPEVQRLTGLEVFAAFLGSAAFLQFAKAIRDFVRKNRLKVRLTRGKRVLEVDASGSDEEWLKRIGTFLEEEVKKH